MSIYIPALIALMLLGLMFSIINERDILLHEVKIKGRLGKIFKFTCYAMLFLISIIMLIVNTHNPFIYQQF